MGLTISQLSFYTVSLRRANHPPLSTDADIPEILAMIRELADYEHALDKVEATEQSLLATLAFAPSSPPTTQPQQHQQQPEFSPGYARTILLTLPPSTPSSTAAAAAATETVAGMALFFPSYSTWTSAPGIYLEDLFVRPAHRRRGYGRLLIRGLAREAVRMGGRRLEWSCLRWNEPSLQFYRGLGAREMGDWVGLRVDGEELVRLAEEGEGNGDVSGRRGE